MSQRGKHDQKIFHQDDDNEKGMSRGESGKGREKEEGGGKKENGENGRKKQKSEEEEEEDAANNFEKDDVEVM